MSGLGLPATMSFLITALVLFGPNAIPFFEKSRSGVTGEFTGGTEKDRVKGWDKREPA